VVELTQRTAAGDWYQATNARGISGWVSADLLGIPDEVAQAVPVAP
jgi:flagellar FliL protein